MRIGTSLRAGGIAVVAALLLAACQNMPPPAPAGKTVTVGDTTIIASGRVRVEGGYVK